MANLYANQLSVPVAMEPSYHGSLEAQVFEHVAVPGSPDLLVPTNHIRTTQTWGIDIRWETHGAAAQFLIDEFHIRFFLESIGTGPEYDLPVGGDLVVATMSGVLSFPIIGGVPTPLRTYSSHIHTAPGTVVPGVYKLVVRLQLHDDAPGATPYPIAGMVEGPFINFFNPGP